MKPRFDILFLFGVFLLRVSAISQVDVSTLSSLHDIPKFYFEALSFSSDQKNMTRLDVFVEIPYEALHFTNEGNMYRADYDITVDIRDTLENIIAEKTWDETIETKSYDESVSLKTSNLSQKSFLVAPGRYGISVQIDDHETKKISRVKRTLNVKDLSQPLFSLSDLMLANHISIENGKKIVSPNISGNIGVRDNGFFVVFEAYLKAPVDSALTFVKIYNTRKIVVQLDSFYQQYGAEKRACYRKVDISKLIAGDYVVAVEVYPRSVDQFGKVNDAAFFSSRPFAVHWRGLPVTISDIDLAIDEMQYITEKDKLDEIRKAEKEQRKQLFQEFWKKKDPTPNTERNELMEEYYARVEYANKNFGHYIDGWKSDMGMVYIIFGPPNNVERHPFDLDSKPYEIWAYYEQNRQFVFIDASGFGDYRLQDPIWDVWRTRLH